MSIKLNTLHHVGLVVSDMDRSLAFYKKLIGNDPKVDLTGSGPELTIDNPVMRIVMIGFNNGGTGLELIEYKSPKGKALHPKANDSNSLNFCFKVSDAKEVYHQMVADGYQFVAEPQFLDQKYGAMQGHTFGYFHGPDGELLEIMQDPSFIEKLVGNDKIA